MEFKCRRSKVCVHDHSIACMTICVLTQTLACSPCISSMLQYK
jgi:hypothetical protein